MAAQSNRAMRPFWMHQLVEYVIGASFISAAIASETPVIPIALGVLVLVNAAVALGSAGAFRLVHRQLHRVFDLGIMAVIVMAAIQPIYEIERLTRAVILALGLVMAFVWWNTDFSSKEQRAQRRSGSAKGADRRATSSTNVASTAPSTSGEGRVSSDAGRAAGRSAAQAYLAAKRLKKAMVDDRRPGSTSSPGSSPRSDDTGRGSSGGS